MNESVIQFGPERRLVGIVTDPSRRNPDLPAIVLLNPGLLHRSGPNRLYVQLARALAAEGYIVIRFDFSGLGDSPPRADHLPYAQSSPAEARDAIDWLAKQRSSQRVVLIGHCAGAGIGLLASRDDERVIGAILLNMEGGNAEWAEFDRIKKESQQRARDYTQKAIFDRERWAKLFTGRADYRSISRILFKDILWYRISGLTFRARKQLAAHNATVRAKQASDAQHYLDPIIMRGGGLLLLHSEGSTGLEYIRDTFGTELDRRLKAGTLQLVVIPESDHLFTLIATQRQVAAEVIGWLHTRFVASDNAPAAERADALALSGSFDGR